MVHHVHGVGAVDGGGVDSLFGEHAVVYAGHAQYQLHITRGRRAWVAVAGHSHRQPGIHHLTHGGVHHVEEKGGTRQHGRHCGGAEESLYLCVAGIFEVVAAEGVVFHAHLHTAGAGHLVGVDFGTQSVAGAGFEHAVGLLHGEKPLVAEHVDKVGQTFGGGLGYHLANNEVHKLALPSAVLHRHAVCAKQGGFYRQRRRLFYATYHAQHLKLGFGGEAVAAFYLHGAGAVGCHLVETLHGVIVELLLRGFLQTLGGVEDAAPAFGNFVVGEAFDFVDVLYLAAAGINEVCVRVAESGEHHASAGVDFGIVATFGQGVHASESSETAVLNNEVGVFDGGDFGHVGAFHHAARSSLHLHKLLYVFYQRFHCFSAV